MDAPTPRRLPNRRPLYPEDIEWQSGHATRKGTIDIGTDADGHVCEIFLRGMKTGADQLADNTACFIFASKLLRLGFSAEELLRWIAPSTVDSETGAATPSIVEIALRRVVELEQENGAAIALMHGTAPVAPPLRNAGKGEST